MADNKHKNDIYGDLSKTKAEEPATPAATVVLLRDTDSGPEVLMLKKNARIDFGGMWVFPGGRIDEEDYPSDRDLESAARTAAARETIEEANVPTKPDDFVWFAHWTRRGFLRPILKRITRLKSTAVKYTITHGFVHRRRCKNIRLEILIWHHLLGLLCITYLSTHQRKKS